MKLKLAALILLAGLAVFALGATKASSRVTWEYKVLYHDHYEADKELNKQGGEGWELIAVEPTSFEDPRTSTMRHGNTYYFKRPK